MQKSFLSHKYWKNTVFTHLTRWLKKLCGNCGVNIMIMPLCTVQLPEGLAVLHDFLKVSVGLKEVRCAQHAAISLRQERNLSTLCSHSTLVTQASSEIGAYTCTDTVTGKTHRRKPHT